MALRSSCHVLSTYYVAMDCNARLFAMLDDLAGANWRWYYSSYLLDALWGGMGLLLGEDKMELPLKSGSFKEI